MIDYETLKLVWWLFIGVLLVGFAVTGGFDLGIGALLPFVAYVMLVVAAGLAHSQVRLSWFLAAGAALLLLFIGIHNAWDAATYHIFSRTRGEQESAD